MRKLKLEIQLSIDGFVADPKDKTNWMVWDWKPEWTWDKKLKQYHTDLQTSSDTLLMGRKMADSGFIKHWQKIADNKQGSQHQFAQAILDMKKYVFSRHVKESKWDFADVITNDTVRGVNMLKKQDGKDIIVYGGAGFVASLIKEQLIDEYHLFINPTIIGRGKTIFKEVDDKINLNLESAKTYDCGVTVLKYVKQ